MRLFSLSKKAQKHVAIIIDQHYITCAWLEQPVHRADPPTRGRASHSSPHNSNYYQAPFIIKAYEKKALDAPNSPDCLFNPTAMGTTIAQFIKTHIPNQPLKHTILSCAFTPVLITERLVKLNHATPSPADFPRHHSSHAIAQNAAWDYHYLYPTDTHEYVFYTCGIAQPLLLQYKLLAIKHKLDLYITTSQTAALLQLYRYTHGAAFRSSQLGIDMQRAHNNPELLFSDELVRRVISIPKYSSGEDTLIDKKTALTFAGLMAQAVSS